MDIYLTEEGTQRGSGLYRHVLTPHPVCSRHIGETGGCQLFVRQQRILTAVNHCFSLLQRNLIAVFACCYFVVLVAVVQHSVRQHETRYVGINLQFRATLVILTVVVQQINCLREVFIDTAVYPVHSRLRCAKGVSLNVRSNIYRNSSRVQIRYIRIARVGVDVQQIGICPSAER